VVGRLIKAAAALDYPPAKLQIQVLDDSSDDTAGKAAELVQYYNRQGVNIVHLRRMHRQGYKAGALNHGLAQASGEFLAIFDADFQPAPDFLRQTIPHFLNEPQLGMVQTRWGHLNSGDSPLTAAQAIALDKHFAIEQAVRHRARLFPKFNGAAGIWRKSCVLESGGWLADTVCEDLCLSTRAVLGGWEFQYLNDVVTPAELPTSVIAYKSQQARWAKGSIQCLVKYGREIFGNRGHPIRARWYAALSMSAYATHLLLLAMLFVQVPMLYFHITYPSGTFFMSLAGIFQPLLFVLAQQTLYSDWRQKLYHFPALLLLAIGVAPSNAWAILQAAFGRTHSFVRTPKGESHSPGKRPEDGPDYHLPLDNLVLVEIFLALYAGLGLAFAIGQASVGPAIFMGTCLAGFVFVASLSLKESFREVTRKWRRRLSSPVSGAHG
jgi:cellulose synthase/poly-beta-1,6-N-acetylglucosamine synthase-like glycosyltransferase